MSQLNDAKKTSKRSSNGKAKQLSLAGFGVPDKETGAASWGETLPESTHAVIDAVTRLGGAVLFGGSRDRGSLLVTLYLEGDRTNVWIGAGEDFEERLYDIARRIRELE